jgi:hypothetical protein
MIKKIWKALIHLDFRYSMLINGAINRFSQEIINFDKFEGNGLQPTLSPDEAIEFLSEELDEKQYRLFESTALEFCITNDYSVNGKRWNCVEHLIKHHELLFSSESIKYLEALNKSYASIYKVSFLEDSSSIELSNMLKENDVVTIAGKKQVSDLRDHQVVATRVLRIKTKNKVVYKISNTLLPLTKEMTEGSVHVINFILSQMNSAKHTKPSSSLTQNEILLRKKMMIKEILEQWYLHSKKESVVYH